MPEKMDTRLQATSPKTMVFANVDRPQAAKLRSGSAKPEYSASFVLDVIDPDFTALKNMTKAVIRDVFPAVKSFSEVHLPWQTAEQSAEYRATENKEPYPFLESGKVLLKAKSGAEYAPNLGSLASGKLVQYRDGQSVALHAAEFFPGAEAFYTIKLAGYTVDGRRYVKAYLQDVCVTGKGTRMGGSSSMSAFEQYAQHISSASVVDEIDDNEIPF